MVSTLIFVPVAYLGIDQVRHWLRSLGWLGVGLATGATAIAMAGVQLRYESYFWTCLAAVPIWLLALTAVWTVECAHHARALARRDRPPVDSISLNTLTKTYGAPGRLRLEWGRFERRAKQLIDAGIDPIDRRSVKDGLLWKSPLLALLIFLHAYLVDPVWLYVTSAATWGLLVHLAHSVGLLMGSPAPKAVTLGIRYFFLALLLVYIQQRLELPSVTTATALTFVALRWIRWLAGRVESGVVDIDRMSGRSRWLRGPVYRVAAAVPILGAKKATFTALAGVNLEIGRGMFGLLGPNGAGKTTLMRILCQVLEPTFGSVSVNGVNLARHQQVQGLIGYLPQHFGTYDNMSGYDYLQYRGLLEGFKDKAEREERVLACLEQVNLLDRKHDLIGTYSGGMKQRIGIAQMLLHMPQIMIVDEPTAGLDPVERIRFRNLLARLSKDRIVIFSTHIVEDIAGSCNRLAVINSGRCIYTGSPDAMRVLAQGKVWEAVLDDEVFHQVEADLDIITHLRTPAGIRVRFLVTESPPDFTAVDVEPTLEDAYIYLLGEHRRAA